MKFVMNGGLIAPFLASDCRSTGGIHHGSTGDRGVRLSVEDRDRRPPKQQEDPQVLGLGLGSLDRKIPNRMEYQLCFLFLLWA